MSSYTKEDLIAAFEDYINDYDGTITIAGIDFDPAWLLKQADPIAYREKLLGFADNELRYLDEEYGEDSEEYQELLEIVENL